MACSRCQTLPLSPKERGQLLLTAPVPELIERIREFLAAQRLAFQAERLVVRLADTCLMDFLERIREAQFFNALERRDIAAALLAPHEDLTFDAFNRTRSLERWLSLLEARGLLEILEEQRFLAWFQPILSARTQAVIGHEALLRGQRADGSLMFPGEIFGCAAENDLMFQVDRQARQTALRAAVERQLSGLLFLNFVPTAIYDPTHCLQSTVGTAKQLGIQPERIVFEVIETEKVGDIAHLKTILEFYRAAGFRVALDDVGSGYASLKMLTMLRPDIIKVDMEIVRGIHADPDRQTVFRALVGLARDLGIQVLTEGIETEDELAYVVAAGADLVQGYLFGRPVPDPAEQRIHRDPGSLQAPLSREQ